MYENNNENSMNELDNNQVESQQAEVRNEAPANYTWENPQPVQEPVKPEKKSSDIWRKIMVAACCGLCFGLFGGLGLYAVQQVPEIAKVSNEVYESNSADEGVIDKQDAVSKPNQESIPVASTGQVSVVTSDYSAIVEEVMPAMVSILNTTVTETRYWGQVFEEEEQYSGSGIIIAETDKELLIATNHHVVAGATKLEVNFIDGSIVEAQIKGTDADMDLAVIAIPLENMSKETMQAIVIAKMGDSDALKLGEPVIAIGNALGYGQSVTGGYISALNREITMSDGSVGTFIQTDAAINPGNSGGALLNVKGEVIGINSSKIGGSYVEGMGYAIPITAAEPIIGDLMNKETRYKVDEVGYMGTTLMTITDEQAYMYNFPQGIFVRDVEKDSPAEKAGILKGDIIVNFDGDKVTSYDDLAEIMQYYGPGSEAKITVMRASFGQYEEVEVTITLGKKPSEE